MNILAKLTKRNLKLNKKRAIGTTIGIMLSVALICAVSGMFTSFRKTVIEDAISERGYYHIALETINKEELEKYKFNKDVKEINSLYKLGDAYMKGNAGMNYLSIYSAEKDNFNKLAYQIIEGNFPKSTSEIVISKKMAMDFKLKIGDHLNLDIGTRKTIDNYELNDNNPYLDENKEYLDNSVSKNYKIVGITYRERNSKGIYGITTGETSDKILAYVSLKNPRKYEESLSQLLGVSSFEEVEMHKIPDIRFQYTLNDELLRWEAFKFSDQTIGAISAIAAVVISIIIIVSVFCIRNSFAISTTEKMKMYGMLSSIGATKKQIKKSVILEGLLLGLIGIPLGILCGVLAVFILIKVINILIGPFLLSTVDGIIFDVSLFPILISIILGIVTIYFSSIASAIKASRVSPIDNLRNNQNIKITPKKLKSPKIIKSLFKTGGVLAYKNLKRSKKKYRTTVISLTVSIFVFISMFYFINEGFKQSSMYYSDYNYNIVVLSGNIHKYSESDLDRLRNLKNVKNTYTLYSEKGTIKLLDSKRINEYPDLDYGNGSRIDIRALDNESFKKYVKELGLNYDKVKEKGILINDLKYYSTSAKKTKVVDIYNYKKGEKINLNYELDDVQKDFSIELASVTDKRPAGLESYYSFGGFLIVDLENTQYLEFEPERLMIDATFADKVAKDIELIDSELVINNFDEAAQAERAMVIVISIFLYGFIGVITLIGVTNIFNTLTSNMELRQKEFAMLKSIGMTKREFNRMINLETLFYSSKSLIYGIILGLIGSYLLHLGFNENIEMKYSLPITGIIISIVFVFIIVYIIMKYSISKINKQNTIETIRKENV